MKRIWRLALALLAAIFLAQTATANPLLWLLKQSAKHADEVAEVGGVARRAGLHHFDDVAIAAAAATAASEGRALQTLVPDGAGSWRLAKWADDTPSHELIVGDRLEDLLLAIDDRAGPIVVPSSALTAKPGTLLELGRRRQLQTLSPDGERLDVALLEGGAQPEFAVKVSDTLTYAPAVLEARAQLQLAVMAQFLKRTTVIPLIPRTDAVQRGGFEALGKMVKEPPEGVPLAAFVADRPKQLLVIVGHMEGDRLVVRGPGNIVERSEALNDIYAAADKAGSPVLILGCQAACAAARSGPVIDIDALNVIKGLAASRATKTPESFLLTLSRHTGAIHVRQDLEGAFRVESVAPTNKPKTSVAASAVTTVRAKFRSTEEMVPLGAGFLAFGFAVLWTLSWVILGFIFGKDSSERILTALKDRYRSARPRGLAGRRGLAFSRVDIAVMTFAGSLALLLNFALKTASAIAGFAWPVIVAPIAAILSNFDRGNSIVVAVATSCDALAATSTLWRKPVFEFDHSRLEKWGTVGLLGLIAIHGGELIGLGLTVLGDVLGSGTGLLLWRGEILRGLSLAVVTLISLGRPAWTCTLIRRLTETLDALPWLILAWPAGLLQWLLSWPRVVYGR